jgi:D-alanyl-D-alanine carboxypeptidase
MEQNNESTNNQPVSKSLLLLNTLVVFLIVLFFFAIYGKKHVPIVKVIEEQQKKVVVEEPPIKDVLINAKSAFVYDLTNRKVLYKKNELEQLPLASLTKLMMALTAIDLLPKDAKITIKNEFLSEEGDSGLLANESWKLEDLLDFSLVSSSNDGARSIASVIGATQLNSSDYNLGRKEFVRRMNMKAQDLGLANTYFVNESGLDVGSASGGYGTARDVSYLIEYILNNKPELVEATRYSKITVNSDSKKHDAKNTNSVLDEIPGLIVSKTGYTSMAGGNLAVAFDASMGKPIIVVVLGSTQEDRFEDVKTLVNASLEYLAK